MKKHANLSIFVPHAGCPQMCSFCDQNAISGTQAPPKPDYVIKLCEEFLPQKGENTEIAFFGGSFTAINEEYRVSLLAAAFPFVKQGRAKGVRISTRPDAINAEILVQLKEYGVTAIELGAQNMTDEILRLNNRGHSARDVENAAKLIKEYGFELGLQMMPGLYGVQNYYEDAMFTAQKLIDLQPDTLRIYPAITLKNTMLAQLYYDKKYIPLTIDEAAHICADIMLKCEEKGVKVIRVGLAADQSLEEGIVAGPYHPAFRQICDSALYFDKMKKSLCKQAKGYYIIEVAKGQMSSCLGQKKDNINKLFNMGYFVKVVENEELDLREIIAKRV